MVQVGTGPREQGTDVLIIGGGVGGCAAALAAARLGRRVILTEELDWLGGQLTSQAVPPDEHQWMEQLGGTQSYRRLRAEARDYYRRHYPLTPDARFDPALKLGASLVTRAGAEPRVWLAALEAMLAPFRSAGRVTVWPGHKPVAVHGDGDRVHAVTLRDLERGQERTFAAPYVLDATELGDLLPLGGVEYVSGRESRAQTAAPHWRGAGQGYPGLRLRPDVVDTSDWLAKAPYIREGRRIRAELTVLEQHISAEVSPEGPTRFPDSVGIGRYGVDIHLSTPASRGGQPERSRTRVTSRPGGESRPRAWPFQIPLGALLPLRVENLLPAGKNLGVTHITNGSYRLHPVEWNVGEAAGALAAFCLDRGLAPRQVRAGGDHQADFQYLLQQMGVELEWPDLAPGGSYNQWANRRRRHSWGETPDELPQWKSETTA